ncbi:MAG: hypothetical protein ACTJHT_02510, partial [Sphingobacterium sp.]
MHLFLRYVVVLQIFIFSFIHISFAQQDTLISFDELEFTSGEAENSDSPTNTGEPLIEVPEDLEFTDGAAQDLTSQ